MRAYARFKSIHGQIALHSKVPKHQLLSQPRFSAKDFAQEDASDSAFESGSDDDLAES